MEDLNLSEFFTTKSQATEFMVKIDQLMAAIFETKFDLESELSKYFSLSQKEKFLKLLRINKVDPKKPTELKQFFEKIKEAASTMKILTIKLAFEPTEKNLINFSNWFRMNVKKQYLFEITVDPTLVAGAEIKFNGKYFDFSIRKTLEQIFNPPPATNGQQYQPQLNNHQVIAKPI